MAVTRCIWAPKFDPKIPIQRDRKIMKVIQNIFSVNIGKSHIVSSNKTLHFCFSTRNYKPSMTAYAHRMPTLYITNNNYYSNNKVFIYINFVFANNMNSICTITLQHTSLTLFVGECQNATVTF